jgi:hypothetical protein
VQLNAPNKVQHRGGRAVTADQLFIIVDEGIAPEAGIWIATRSSVGHPFMIR